MQEPDNMITETLQPSHFQTSINQVEWRVRACERECERERVREREIEERSKITNVQKTGLKQVFWLKVGRYKSIWSLIAFEDDKFSRRDELEGSRTLVNR